MDRNKEKPMKNISKILILSMIISNIAHAASDEYSLFCGNKAQLEAVMHAQGQTGSLTKKDIKELSEQRAPLLSVLAKGVQGIREVLDEGNKSDTGGFGALLVCGLATQLKSEIQASGCYDLQTNQPVMDNGGIAACETLLAAVPKK
jgi:hypothetical protein